MELVVILYDFDRGYLVIHKDAPKPKYIKNNKEKESDPDINL